jgi:hypothetical protein
MVPGVCRHRLPLLPFERELIKALGCTEEQYRFFAAQAEWRSRVRPAGYEHIPDVRADVVSIVVSLVIGVALSAASALLTPKPRMASARDRGGQRTLSSRTGATAFGATTGFDSQAEVADYGEPVPIIFGRYTGATGGVLAAPKLVWSRAFSYGTQQGVKLLMAVGEAGRQESGNGIARPDLQGIFLGTSPLDAAFAHTFAFYWRSRSREGSSRLLAETLRYGTRGGAATGDPQDRDDVFLCPTSESQNDTGFCMAYSPSANVEFGCYAPIYNGTDYRVNFRIIPLQSVPDAEDDPGAQIGSERAKITGTDNDRVNPTQSGAMQDLGQRGVGRGYSRRMGLVALNGQPVSGVKDKRTVAVGDRVTFQISGRQIPENFYYNQSYQTVKVDDINNELNSQRSAADGQLQLGETFMIGYTLWKVVDRTAGIWDEGRDVTVTLECIELLSERADRKQIGLIGPDMLTRNYLSDNATNFHAPPEWYPLVKAQIGIVRNARPCDATEIGIKSQVWNQANGLCNFSSLISPNDLVRADKNRVAISSGTMTLYFRRTSVFTLQLRPAGRDNDGNEYEWEPLRLAFCVTGEQPVDQFNFIRLMHPQRASYEFRMVPRSGADLIQSLDDEADVWQLDARSVTGERATLTQVMDTRYGPFVINSVGRLVRRQEIIFNEEMATGPVSGGVIQPFNTPTAATIVDYLPQSSEFDQRFYRQAWSFEVFGNANNRSIGAQRTVKISETVGAKGTLVVSVTATVRQVSSGFPDTVKKIWTWPTVVVSQEESTGVWVVGDTVRDYKSISAENLFGDLINGADRVAAVFSIDALKNVYVSPAQSGARIFESTSQLADVSHYSNLINRSNASSPEHQITYVNEMVANERTPKYENLTMAGLALKASRTYASLDQIRVWLADGLPVQRFHPDEDGTFGPSNLFCDLVYYLLTDKTAGAGELISPELIKTEDFADTAKFLRRNDLFFDGAISAPTNIRQFIADTAPFFLCNFVIADGKFSLVPALPTTRGGNISMEAVPISGLFTSGNIIEESFEIEYLSSEERNDFQAVVRYREERKNQLPQERTLNVRWNKDRAADDRIETFDLTQYCTSKTHAALVAKYFMSLRRRVTHTVRFKTSPYGLQLAPGSFIRVVTEASPYSGANNGIVDEEGAITAANPLDDGTYSVIYYKPGAPDVDEGSLVVVNGRTTQERLYGAVFSVVNASTSSNVYMIEQLTLDQDGMVQISATEFPTDSGYSSLMAQDVLSGTAFVVEG